MGKNTTQSVQFQTATEKKVEWNKSRPPSLDTWPHPVLTWYKKNVNEYQ